MATNSFISYKTALQDVQRNNVVIKPRKKNIINIFLFITHKITMSRDDLQNT